MSGRSALFQNALCRAKLLASTAPEFTPVISIVRQLEYLIAVENGDQTPDRLKKINIGLLAAREIESLDDVLADELHRCSAEVQKMSHELK